MTLPARCTTALHALALTCFLAALSGCGILPESKKIDYKSATKTAPLDIPPDLSAPGRDERYALPDDIAKGSTTFSAYANERGGGAARTAGGGKQILPDAKSMRIERAGTQRWLVVPGTPESLWADLKEFWQESGFLVNIESPQTGVMETEWAENRAKLPNDFLRNTLGKIFDDLYSTSERDKFRTRIERGAEPNTVEIYVSHRGLYEVYVNEGKSQTRWQPREADPDLEAEMLRRLMVRLGSDEATAKTLLADKPASERAKLSRDASGGGTLVVEEAFDRAWRRVGLALDRINFTVEDRDRAQGLYFVRYIDPEADANSKPGDGILSSLMFWKSDARKKAAESGDKFRILVKSANGSTSIQVLTREGGIDTSSSGGKILGLLHDELK